MPETLSLFGIQISLYYLFWFLGLIAVLVIGYWTGTDKRYCLNFSKSILYVALAVAIGYALLWVTSWVMGGGKMMGLNFVRVVTVLPIAIFLLSLIFRDSFLKICDFVAPLMAIFHGVTHIGCIFPGCCHGYPSQWGIFSNSAGTVCFPTQPIEAVSSLVIGVVLLIMMKKQLQVGKLYAWYLILFGLTRFLWEFLRDNEKIAFGVSELAIHALIAFVVGASGWIVLTIIEYKRRTHEKS